MSFGGRENIILILFYEPHGIIHHHWSAPALLEDLGRAGDITSAAVVRPDAELTAVIQARQPGRIAGIAAARMAFRLMDSAISFEVTVDDGAPVAAGSIVAHVKGNARAILAAERVALNLLCHLSGIATATAVL